MGTLILVGDVREQLDTLKDQSIQCCVTSPPYYGLRDYGVAGQIGLEPTLAEYIATMVDVFRGVRRVLRDDGTLWLNIGDSYAAARGGTHQPAETLAGGVGGYMPNGDRVNRTRHDGYSPTRDAKAQGLKHKDLMMVPARLAIALQDDGWYLRSDIIWAKPNPMPESVRDRPTSAHEHIFLLTKQARYFYDADAVAETALQPSGEPTQVAQHKQSALGRTVGTLGTNYGASTRNQRNVWTITTHGFPEAHFATFPPEIPRRCIKAGTSEKGQCPECGKPYTRITDREAEQPTVAGSELDRFGNGQHGVHRKVGGQYQKWLDENPKQTTGWAAGCDCNAGDPVPQTVLDPFGGAMTTMLEAERLNRLGIAIELNPEYAEIGRKRLYNDAPLFATA